MRGMKLFAGLTFVLAAAALLLVQAVDVSEGIEWDGSYMDPNHVGCARHIKVQGTTAEVIGEDGVNTPACTGGEPTKAWKLQGHIDGKTILVDFSPKGGPKDLLGKWVGDGIVWPDGNKWSKVPCEGGTSACAHTVA